MTNQTPGCGSNSEARKRRQEAADPHAGCEPGTCKAGDQWRSVSCAGDAPAAVSEARRGLRALCLEVHESIVNDLTRLVEEAFAALAAQPAAPQPTEGGALTEAEREQLDEATDTAFVRPEHADPLIVAVERIKADAYAAGLAARSQRLETPAVESLTWCGTPHPGGCSVPDHTGVCELSVTPDQPAQRPRLVGTVAELVVEFHRAEEAEERGEGICRTCLNPIWNEGGTVGHRKRDEGWSDRIERGGDSLVCFRAIHYRHVPLDGREAAIYDGAHQRGAEQASATAERIRTLHADWGSADVDDLDLLDLWERMAVILGEPL